MRSGVIEQTLTPEAASILKHSLLLAKRRGHAQLTPLHVASTLLTSKSTLFTTACLKSHPNPNHNNYQYPLQCRALELCFNVSLNRLPTAPSNPNLVHSQPSLSNALIAALKRAQAHQRRGCVDHQQPLLSLKVELEQLIISILDDPSVSRVMREAGFSSTAVKSNINIDDTSDHNSFWNNYFMFFSDSHKKLIPVVSNYYPHEDDVKLVLQLLLRKKRTSTVIVGDSPDQRGLVISELMGRFSRGDVPEGLKKVRFVKFEIVSLKRDPVEKRVSELKADVAKYDDGIIIYMGDLRWVVSDDHDDEEREVANYVVEEIAKVISNDDEIGKRMWIMGTASYQTYIKFQKRNPSLETQWAIQPISVPSAGLGFSLHAPFRVHDSRIMFSENPYSKAKLEISNKDERDQYKLSCCSECTSNCEKEAELLKTATVNQKLPAWLQPHGTHFPYKDQVVELSKKWSRLCRSLHQGRQTQSPIAMFNLINGKSHSQSQTQSHQYPLWHNHNTITFGDPCSNNAHLSQFQSRHRPQNSCTIEFGEGSLDFLKSMGREKEDKITLALGNSITSGSWQCGLGHHKIKIERSLQRDEMSKILKDNVPWQSEAIPSVVDAMIVSETKKRETWLLIHGNDNIGKRRLARAVAESLIGSSDLIVLNERKQSSEITEECEILKKALKSSEKAVVFVQDIDSADPHLMRFLSYYYQTGKFGDITRKESIFIVTKSDGTSSINNKDSVIQMTLNISHSEKCSLLENLKFNHKRKSLASLWKIPNHSNKRRLFDFNSKLDLNIKAWDEEEYCDGEKAGELSTNSSDLTRETTADQIQNKLNYSFVDSIENVLVFNRSPARDHEMNDLFLSKMEDCFEEVMCGKQNVASLSVDESVLEDVSVGSAFFSNSLFEKWVRGVFQNALKTIRISGKEKGGGVVVRLCLGLGGAKEEGILENGFMGSRLPNKILLCYKD